MEDFWLSNDDKIEVWLEILYVNNRRFAWTNSDGLIPVWCTPKENLIARSSGDGKEIEIYRETIFGHYVIGF